MFYCIKKTKLYKWKDSPYVLLGDDIVIGCDTLLLEYLRVMEILGVEISKHKTHQSQHTYEFAKR